MKTYPSTTLIQIVNYNDLDFNHIIKKGVSIINETPFFLYFNKFGLFCSSDCGTAKI
jgi:hypothetical protein